jgi:AraC-like DNA-binding protein
VKTDPIVYRKGAKPTTWGEAALFRTANHGGTSSGGPTAEPKAEVAARSIRWASRPEHGRRHSMPSSATVHPSPVLGVRFMTARGWNFPWRRLAGALEIAWVEKGQAEWQVGRYRGMNRPGSVTVTEPGELAVGRRILAAGDFFQIELDKERFGLDGGLHRQLDTPRATERAAAVARAVRAEDGELAVKSALAELLDILARTPDPADVGTPLAATGLVARMQELVLDRYQEPLSLEELAAAAGISRFKAVRAFRQVLGVTPFEYLRHVRLERAAAALRRGERPIDVAAATGFADQAHLSRSFLAMFQMSPGSFARANVPRSG